MLVRVANVVLCLQAQTLKQDMLSSFIGVSAASTVWWMARVKAIQAEVEFVVPCPKLENGTLVLVG